MQISDVILDYVGRSFLLPVKFNMAAAAILNFLTKLYLWNGLGYQTEILQAYIKWRFVTF